MQVVNVDQHLAIVELHANRFCPWLAYALLYYELNRFNVADSCHLRQIREQTELR